MDNMPCIPKRILVDNLILLGYRGSIAHNMYIPNTEPDSIDDIDLMGVFLAPINFYIGLQQDRSINPQTVEIKKEIDGVMWDCVYYELQKFVKMLLKGNPNVLSMFWLKRDHYIIITEFGKMLLERRDAFITRNVYHSFVGYADGQLKRMGSYSKEGYMGKKRKAVVQKYGYDIYNAAHLIRLLKMGIEFLRSGQLTVYRDPEGQDKYLMDIKRGKWSLRLVKSTAEAMFKTAEKAYEFSKLPDKPDFYTAETMVMNILTDYLKKGVV